VPTDESFGPYDGQGISPIKPATEPHQRQARWIVEPSWSDFAFLVERELFAQEEILGGERSFWTQTKDQQAKEIGKGVQPTQAACHHAPTSFDFGLHPSI